MRTLLLLVLMSMSGCGWVERQRQEAAEEARVATMAQVQRVLAETVQRADRIAGAADRILSPLPVMTPADEDALRTFQNPAHLAVARELGVRVESREARDSLIAAGRLVALEDSTRHWIVRRGASPTYVVPELPLLLDELGERFQERLAAIDLPPYRIEVTSALRTAERQERLRRTNGNAAAGLSSHEFGTTVDLSYAAFAPPADPPASALDSVPLALRPEMERLVDLALESVSGRKSRELGAIFSRVLLEAQTEGLALVIYERQQTVYHVTVGRALADS